MEQNNGRVAVGKLADLAVLSQDIFTVPPPELPETRAVLTLVGGKIVLDTRGVGALRERHLIDRAAAKERIPTKGWVTRDRCERLGSPPQSLHRRILVSLEKPEDVCDRLWRPGSMPFYKCGCGFFQIA